MFINAVSAGASMGGCRGAIHPCVCSSVPAEESRAEESLRFEGERVRIPPASPFQSRSEKSLEMCLGFPLQGLLLPRGGLSHYILCVRG